MRPTVGRSQKKKKNSAGRKKNIFYAILLFSFFFKFCLHLESFAVCSSYLAEYKPFILQAGLFYIATFVSLIIFAGQIAEK